jgi:hypothetical protein
MFAITLQDPPPDPQCTAEIRWANSTQLGTQRNVPRPVSLFTAVSHGRGGCLPAEIRLTATYFDANDDVVCSGTIEDVGRQHDNAQIMNLEVRPGNLFEFARWRNGPRDIALRWKRLHCFSADGQSEVQPAELDRAMTLRLNATVLPAYNGVASAELRMIILSGTQP